jgi:hypothetical protein
MAMQKRYVLVLAIVAGAALFSAQRGPACPYERAEGGGARPAEVAAVNDGVPAEGSAFFPGRAAAFAP